MYSLLSINKRKFWTVKKFSEPWNDKVAEYIFELFIPYKKRSKDKNKPIDAELGIIWINWRLKSTMDGMVRDWSIMLFKRIVIRIGVLQRAKKYRNFSIKRRGR